MNTDMWYFTDDFNKLPARDVLRNILRDDKRNYKKAELELSEDIELLDDAITLYLEPLQAAYRVTDQWKDDIRTRASIAMLISISNYILLARHGILLGYYPEVRDLLRSCYERICRAHLFFHDVRLAHRFLSGEQIKQSEVDKELSKLEKLDRRNELFQSLRSYYAFLSDVIHPNLKSFEARYGKRDDLTEDVGLQCIFGGLMSKKHGHVAIIRLLQIVLSALRILGVIIPDQSGSWDKEYQRIRKRCDEMVKTL